jgi:Fe-S cluster assembly protein SufD
MIHDATAGSSLERRSRASCNANMQSYGFVLSGTHGGFLPMRSGRRTGANLCRTNTKTHSWRAAKMSTDNPIDERSVILPVNPSHGSEAVDREGIEILGATTVVKDASTTSDIMDDKGWLSSVMEARLDDSFVTPILHGRRAIALALAQTAEAPSRKMEAWRFTDLRKLFASRFSRPGSVVDVPDLSRLAPSEAGTVLVFVDGKYEPNFSRLDGDAAALVSAGGFVGDIAAYQGDTNTILGVFDQKEVSAESGLFAAVNSALAYDVCVLDIPANHAFAKPLGVVFISSGGANEKCATISAPKFAVIAGEGSDVVLLETHVGADPDSRPWYSSLSSTGLSLSANAKVDHYYLNDSPDSCHQLSIVHADVGADAWYRLCSVSVGGKVGRLDLGIDLNAEGGHAESLGVMVADDYRIVDLHSRISHTSPGCTSKQYQKNIACGHGRVIFCGKIIVERDAQQTESEQLCRSMLLTNKAQIDAMPVLEIAADDVKCTHGATVSDISPDELFYCQSRGLTEAVAQEMLVSSFVGDVLASCPFDLVRQAALKASRKVVPGIQKLPARDRDMMSI